MNRNFSIKQGPQFGGRFTTVILIACIVLFFIAIGRFTFDPISSMWMFVFILLAMPIFLDYQGIEIDLEQSRIRKYKSYLGWKRGKWISLVPFDEIELKWERLRYRSGGTPAMLGGPTKGKTSDVFTIYLVDFLNDHRLEFIDFETYASAKKFMNEYANILELRPNDTYKVLQEKAMKRRNEIESRRRR